MGCNGNGSWTFRGAALIIDSVRQSVLNKDNINVKSEHYGCEGRLAEPVDNKLFVYLATVVLLLPQMVTVPRVYRQSLVSESV